MIESTPTCGVAVQVMHFADLTTPYGYFYRSAGGALSRLRTGLQAGPDALTAPCLAFLIRHPEGPVLIDTGLHTDAHANLGADFGFPMRLLFHSLRPVGRSFDRQLRDLGVAPETITQVVMTDLHVDHTSAMRLLPNAQFVCAQQEWEAAHGPRAAVKGYVSKHLPSDDRVRLIDLARDGVPHGALSHTVDLVGDGSIRLVWTPGHTPGHMSVLVSTSDQGDLLLAGDAAYSRRNVEEDILPMLTDDDGASRRSIRQLRDYMASSRQTLLVPSHDPDAWHDIGPADSRATA